MRRTTALAVLCLLASSAPAVAGGTTLYGGYSFVSAKGTSDDRVSFHGGDVTLTVPLGARLGLDVDLSHVVGKLDGADGSIDTLMAGPRLSLGAPFLRVVAGGVRSRAGLSVFGVDISAKETDFGLSGGAGLDFRRAKRWGFRVQAEALVTFAEGSTTTDPRASAGVVLRFGQR